MIDLHTHSFLSDGVLLPAELVRRAEHIGYNSIGITDHIDQSNVDFIVPRIAELAETLNRFMKVGVIPGVEITHVPPETIKGLADRARSLGAKLIVVHGETIVEPVPPGTDHHAIEAGIDILAHPVLIAPEDVELYGMVKDFYRNHYWVLITVGDIRAPIWVNGKLGNLTHENIQAGALRALEVAYFK